MKSTRALFKNIDMVGPKFLLEFEGGSRFLSIQGSIISLGLYGFLISISFIFGTELWERKKPYYTQSKIQKENTVIPLYKFPLMFSLYTDSLENVLNFDEYLMVETQQSYGILTRPDNPDPVTFINVLNLYKCDPSEAYDYYKGSKFGNATILCPDADESNYLLNDAGSANSIHYKFYFYKCDPAARKCADDLEDKFETLRLIITTVDNSVDPTIYSKPLVSFENNISVLLSNWLMKKVLVTFEKNELVSDYGWIFENLVSDIYFKTSSSNYEYLFLPPGNTSPKIVISISTFRQITRVCRSYLKIQELFAKIGGIANALFIIFEITFSSYLEYTMKNNILYSIPGMELSSLVESQSPSSNYSSKPIFKSRPQLIANKTALMNKTEKTNATLKSQAIENEKSLRKLNTLYLTNSDICLYKNLKASISISYFQYLLMKCRSQASKSKSYDKGENQRKLMLIVDKFFSIQNYMCMIKYFSERIACFAEESQAKSNNFIHNS